MKKIVVLKSFVQSCVFLVDSGEAMSLDEVKDRIYKRNIIDSLKEKHGQNDILINSLSPSDTEFLHNIYLNHLEVYDGDEYGKWGVKNNGLNLLITWGVEFIRDTDENDMIKG